MFPFISGFHGTTGQLVFLGLFYTVLTVVFSTVVVAVARTRRDLRKAPPEVLRWQLEFADLPVRARACRHEISGRVRDRSCRHGFDCGTCDEHASLLAVDPHRGGATTRPRGATERASSEPAHGEPDGKYTLDRGLDAPWDRLYHRGHTWARIEDDGTMTVGLDDLGRRLVGERASTELPAVGTRLYHNGPAWLVTRRGCTARMLSPVDGVVTAVGGAGDDWVLRLAPPAGGFETRHLLKDAEVDAWMLREVDRLQLALSAPAAPSLADGGAVMEDLPAAAPEADWDAVWGEMFLEA